MRKITVIFFCMLSAVLTLRAQDTLNREVKKFTYDSLIHYLGNTVSASDSVWKAMCKKVEENKGRSDILGYRIRIYFDNSQDARSVSQTIVDSFSVHYPNVPVYRNYVNPYFKVTVGNFRSRSDAMRFLEAIRPEYPTVFLVREPFSTI